MTFGTFSIQEVLKFGWETFKKDPWFYVGVTFVLMAFSLLVNALTTGPGGVHGILGFIISFAASTIVSIAYARLALSAEAGEHVTWQELWAPEHFLNMVGASLVQAVIIFVGIILLVIPGIVAALILMFTQLSVVDKGLNPIEALKNSYYLTKGHLLELFVFVLVIMVLNIIGLLALVIGLLVTLPVSLIAVAHVYRILANKEVPVIVEPHVDAA